MVKFQEHLKMLRTEFVWSIGLDGDWSPIKDTPRGEKYDLGIVIILKNNPQVDINHFKTFCDKVKSNESHIGIFKIIQ